MIVAVVNQSSVPDTDVVFWAQAWNDQALEVAAAWGVAPISVVFYSSTDELPASDYHLLTISDTIDMPGAYGYHEDFDGIIRAVISTAGLPSRTGSHEVLEELVDPTSGQWAPWVGGKQQAKEICDRVESDVYTVQVTVLGETREVQVSNYLLPSAFDPAGQAPFDKLGHLTTWSEMTPGGYAIVRDPGGTVTDVSASKPTVVAGPGAGAALAMKLGRGDSRLLHRLRG